MTIRLELIIHLDETETDSKDLKRQILQIRGVKVVGITGKKRLE
jgi:hypothetical protein